VICRNTEGVQGYMVRESWEPLL